MGSPLAVLSSARIRRTIASRECPAFPRGKPKALLRQCWGFDFSGLS